MSRYTAAVAGVLGESHLKTIALVEAGATVLEVGPAGGYVTRALIEQGAAAVDCIELDAEDAAAAADACRTMIVGSVEDDATLAQIADEAYDVVLCGDVLEHLRDSLAAVRALSAKLKPGGVFIASVPNVAHHELRLALLRGRFDYTDIGPMDRTHLRFFTRRTLRELMQDAGLVVEREDSTYKATALERRIAGLLAARGGGDEAAATDAPAAAPAAGGLRSVVDAALQRAPGLLAYQLIVLARKP